MRTKYQAKQSLSTPHDKPYKHHRRALGTFIIASQTVAGFNKEDVIAKIWGALTINAEREARGLPNLAFPVKSLKDVTLLDVIIATAVGIQHNKSQAQIADSLGATPSAFSHYLSYRHLNYVTLKEAIIACKKELEHQDSDYEAALPYTHPDVFGLEPDFQSSSMPPASIFVDDTKMVADVSSFFPVPAAVPVLQPEIQGEGPSFKKSRVKIDGKMHRLSFFGEVINQQLNDHDAADELLQSETGDYIMDWENPACC